MDDLFGVTARVEQKTADTERAVEGDGDGRKEDTVVEERVEKV